MSRHILILVENLSVPFDRRVWQESCALVEAGYQVTVICPRGQKEDQAAEETLDSVRILRYPLRAAQRGRFGYLREYVAALWHSVRLTVKVRRSGPIHAIQACNPPDLLFLIGFMLRPWGTRFVFDHHDLVPELFLSRFGGKRGALYGLTVLFERATFAAADAVIATNESYRNVAITRGKVPADRVSVVRSAPDLRRFTPLAPDDSLRCGKRYLLAYLGVMGPQDGVDYALRAVKILREVLGRNDVHCIFMGTGDAQPDLIRLSRQLKVADIVDFPGRVPDDYVRRCLSTADVCISPDPKNPLNDLSTMNKVLEYMAMGRPIVSFDLTEARVSAGDSAIYAPANDEVGFARSIDSLLRNPQRRHEMGTIGRSRVEGVLSWETSRRRLVELYDKLLSDTSSAH